MSTQAVADEVTAMEGVEPPGLEFRGVSKRLGDVQAVDDVTLAIREGEFFTLLVPSGSGKTTSLNLVAGFLAQDDGAILIRGRSVTGLPPEKRDVGIVFQSYALFPHMSVLDNVAFPLRRRGLKRAEAHARARAALELVSLGGREAARPAALSGGQQQRAALARALVFEPKLILLDEPLGALDRRLRQHLQEQLRELHRQVGFTAVYITHDQEEAMALSDRMGIMNEGRLEQVGTGEECYCRPRTLFAANFLGDANVVPARVVDAAEEGHCVVRPRDAGAVRAWHPPDRLPGTDVHLIARPEALEVRRPDATDDRPVFASGALHERVFLGQDVLATVRTPSGEEVVVRERLHERELHCQVGDAVKVVWGHEASAVVLPSEAG